MLIYSTSIIEFQTTIHARAITHIILVAEKYSQDIKYNILNQGKTQKKPSKNAIIIIQAILKFLNCPTSSKYIQRIAIIMAVHKSLNVSIVSSHSHHHSILYDFQSFNQMKFIQ